jgi:hypothetical protein
MLWLAPLIAVAIFSIKPDADFTTGNYWGWPSSFEGLRELRQGVLRKRHAALSAELGADHRAHRDRRGGAVGMTGFALGVYKFRGNIWIFFMFVAGNFVPFQILMVPVRDLTLDLGLYNTKTGLVLFHIAFQTGFCTLFMRNFIRALPFPLIEAARVEGVSEWRIFWYVVLPLMKPGHRRAVGADLHLHLERLFLGRRADPGRRKPAGHRRHHQLQRPVPRRLSPDERGQHRRRAAAGGDVLPDAEALHRRV